MTAANQASVQQRYFPTLTCFGCGPANPKGLQLASFTDGDDVVASFTPWPEHDNGLGFLNGGIVATVLDCHSAAAMITDADRRGWLPAEGPALPFVTAGLDVRYRRPTPLTETLTLHAAVVTAAEDELTVEAELHWDGKVRASGTAHWKRWRPRV